MGSERLKRNPLCEMESLRETAIPVVEGFVGDAPQPRQSDKDSPAGKEIQWSYAPGATVVPASFRILLVGSLSSLILALI